MVTKQQRNDLILTLLKLVLILADTAAFAFCWYHYYSERVYIPFFAKGDYLVIALFAAIYVTFARLYGGFDLNVNLASEIVYSQTISILITAFFMYVMTWLLERFLPNVLPLAGLVAVMVLFAVIWATVAKKITNRVIPAKRTVLIYEYDFAKANGDMIARDLPWTFRLVGTIPVVSGSASVIDQLAGMRENVDAVLVCGVSSSYRNDIVKFCIENRIEAFVRPNIGDFLINGAKQLQLSSLPVMLCKRSEPSVFYLFIKRTMDIILSVIGLLVASVPMLITSAAIKLYDHGPVLYKQVRLTKDRKEFYVYKFRSMRVDAEKDGVARLASQNDDRITPVGKIIRATRLDELPQLFCILLGTMTIVGPRPERPEIAEQYEQEMPEFALRLQAKAGLTGYAQVYGKYNTTPYNKLQMDLLYIGNMGIVMDLKIIFATIKILFMAESTEGVADGQTTASLSSEEIEDQSTHV